MKRCVSERRIENVRIGLARSFHTCLACNAKAYKNVDPLPAFLATNRLSRRKRHLSENMLFPDTRSTVGFYVRFHEFRRRKQNASPKWLQLEKKKESLFFSFTAIEIGLSWTESRLINQIVELASKKKKKLAFKSVKNVENLCLGAMRQIISLVLRC